MTKKLTTPRKLPIGKRTVVMEFTLVDAVIDPKREQEFLSAFKGLAIKTREALLLKDNLALTTEVYLR